MDRDTINALVQSYALILIMADETHSRPVTLAWERAKRALEKVGANELPQKTRH